MESTAKAFLRFDDDSGKRVKKETVDYTRCTTGSPSIDALVVTDPVNKVSLFIEPDGSIKTCLAITSSVNPPPIPDAIEGPAIFCGSGRERPDLGGMAGKAFMAALNMISGL